MGFQFGARVTCDFCSKEKIYLVEAAKILPSIIEDGWGKETGSELTFCSRECRDAYDVKENAQG